MKINGACHCGYLTYEAGADAEHVTICHCTDCQTLSGAPFRASVAARDGTFRFLSGAPTIYVKTADSGAKRAQAFCPRCGSPIYSSDAAETPSHYYIRLGTVRQRDQLIPKRQAWTQSSQAWIADICAIPEIEKD